MSASNWAKCPKCAANKQSELETREFKINESYGKVPVPEFLASLEQLKLDQAKAENAEPTFREDYHVTGAADGVIVFTYSGGCTVKGCGLKIDPFVVERPLYPEVLQIPANL